MYNEESRLFNHFPALNSWQVANGMKVNDNGTELSVYITEVKLKKAFKNISDEGIENLFNKELNKISLERHREKLNRKVSTLDKEHLFIALKILLDAEDLDGCAEYILKCKQLRNPDEHY